MKTALDSHPTISRTSLRRLKHRSQRLRVPILSHRGHLCLGRRGADSRELEIQTRCLEGEGNEDRQILVSFWMESTEGAN